jgi:hypothetical protein
MKNEISNLKEQYHAARTGKQRDDINRQMTALSEKDPDAYARAMVELARETRKSAEELLIREQLSEILPAISVAYIAKTYFGKTRTWLYQRINGSLVNGKPAKLSDSERKTLDEAFRDIAHKLTSTHVSPV